MKKKLTAIFLCVALVAIAVVSASLAYFTDTKTATNTFTVGNVKIDLIEQQKGANGLEDFVSNKILLPGTSDKNAVSKIVTVKNTGENAAYVRIQVQKAISLAEGVQGDPDVSLITMDFDRAGWTEKDGYYYYNEPLEPGETTTALFNNVTFAPSMGNMYQNSTATIKVNAQATQVKNNGTDVFTAAGWPESK